MEPPKADREMGEYSVDGLAGFLGRSVTSGDHAKTWNAAVQWTSHCLAELADDL